MKQDKKHGLGRGLDQLLGVSELDGNDGKSSTLPLSKVQPGRNQPRKHFDSDSISDLAESLLLHGMIQPLTVRLLDSGLYQIIAGERRWRAAKEAGLTEVPVNIIEADDRKVMEIGLIENLQREDLNPVEEAKGYQVLMEEYELTQEMVAERMGKSRSSIANALRLLGLPDSILDMLVEGALSAGHARALLGAPTPEVMEEVAALIIANDYSVRRTEEIIRSIKKEQEQEEAEGEELGEEDEIFIYVREAQENLTRNLGRRVLIQHRGARGRVVMEYTDAHDLSDLVEGLEKLQEANYG